MVAAGRAREARGHRSLRSCGRGERRAAKARHGGPTFAFRDRVVRYCTLRIESPVPLSVDETVGTMRPVPPITSNFSWKFLMSP